MICNCEKLQRRIEESLITDDSLAKHLRVSKKKLASKLRDPNGTELTVEDIFKLCEILHIDDPGAYFFTEVVAKMQL